MIQGGKIMQIILTRIIQQMIQGGKIMQIMM